MPGIGDLRSLSYDLPQIGDTLQSVADSYDLNPRPADFGLVAWVGDPRLYNSNVTFSAGIIHLNQLRCPPCTVRNIVYGIATAGVTVTVANIGVYDATGKLLGSVADQSANWMSTGRFIVPLTTPFTITKSQKLWVAVNGTFTTSPAIQRGTGNPILYGAITSSPWPCSDINNAGNPALPAQVDMTQMTGGGTQTFWWGLA